LLCTRHGVHIFFSFAKGRPTQISPQHFCHLTMAVKEFPAVCFCFVIVRPFLKHVRTTPGQLRPSSGPKCAQRAAIGGEGSRGGGHFTTEKDQKISGYNFSFDHGAQVLIDGQGFKGGFSVGFFWTTKTIAFPFPFPPFPFPFSPQHLTPVDPIPAGYLHCFKQKGCFNLWLTESGVKLLWVLNLFIVG